MNVFYTDEFVLTLPATHLFPMAKYRLLREAVVASGLLPAERLCVPVAATEAELSRAHDADYIHRASAGLLTEAEVKRIGFPWSPGLIERSRRSSGATIGACRSALRHGYGVNLAGGTHHAFRDHGEGYCVFNDSVIAARALQQAGSVGRVIVVDCDVHQGNGTAAICRDDDSIYTFSIHGARNFPLRKERSDLDVELPDETTDVPYLDALEAGLTQALSEARAELAIYLAGADPYEGDRLGRLKVTMAGLRERDRMVLDMLAAAGLPVAVTMAGGYAQDVADTVAIQWATVRAVLERGSSPSRSAGCGHSGGTNLR